MKRFKKILTLFIMAAAITGIAFAGGGKDSRVDELDAAVRDTSNYLNSVIPARSKIVILNIQSDSPALSDYIIDELISNAVNDKMFSVVDRQQLDAIRAEQNFQWSGEVADSQALAIGQFFGAQTIISGAIGRLGNGYRLRIRALEVQTALVQGQFNRNINSSVLIADIVASSPVAVTSGARSAAASHTAHTTTAAAAHAPAAATTATQAAVHTYRIGDTGPAGGIIFYDKRNNSGGWRYLEAAPVEAEFQAPRSTRSTNVENLQSSIGSGRRNTLLIADAYSKAAGEWDTAAQKCDELIFGGFDDWFLPSKDELDQMYGQLKRRNLGDFKDDYYWSSTYDGNIQNFRNGGNASIGWGNSYNWTSRLYVRPIRQVPGPN